MIDFITNNKAVIATIIVTVVVTVLAQFIEVPEGTEVILNSIVLGLLGLLGAAATAWYKEHRRLNLVNEVLEAVEE